MNSQTDQDPNHSTVAKFNAWFFRATHPDGTPLEDLFDLGRRRIIELEDDVRILLWREERSGVSSLWALFDAVEETFTVHVARPVHHEQDRVIIALENSFSLRSAGAEFVDASRQTSILLQFDFGTEQVTNLTKTTDDPGSSALDPAEEKALWRLLEAELQPLAA